MDEQTYHAGKRGKMTENKRVRKVRVWAETAIGLEMVYLGEQKCDNGLWFNSPCHIDKYIAEMDFTGLLDKNKTEIWEGDIVKAAFLHRGSPGVPFHAYIFYNDQIGSFRIGYDSLGGGSQDEIYFRYEIEVIGNLYENPELIKS